MLPSRLKKGRQVSRGLRARDLRQLRFGDPRLLDLLLEVLHLGDLRLRDLLLGDVRLRDLLLEALLLVDARVRELLLRDLLVRRDLQLVVADLEAGSRVVGRDAEGRLSGSPMGR